MIGISPPATSAKRKVLGVAVAAATIGFAAAVFLFRAEQSPEANPAQSVDISIRSPAAPQVATINPAVARNTDDRPNSSSHSAMPQVAQAGEFPIPDEPEEPPYTPTVEEQRQYDSFKARAYENGMTLRKFVMLPEYAQLPEPMQSQVFREAVMMAMKGELDRGRFLEEAPAR
jgi:hypothetical protein